MKFEFLNNKLFFKRVDIQSPQDLEDLNELMYMILNVNGVEALDPIIQVKSILQKYDHFCVYWDNEERELLVKGGVKPLEP